MLAKKDSAYFLVSKIEQCCECVANRKYAAKTRRDSQLTYPGSSNSPERLILYSLRGWLLQLSLSMYLLYATPQ
jgi:hypothetical protein